MWGLHLVGWMAEQTPRIGKDSDDRLIDIFGAFGGELKRAIEV